MNILITGFPGTGKSAIAHELRRRGHRAYDPEKMRGYTHTEDRQTGKHIHVPEGDIPHGWYDTVGAQMWDQVHIRELLNSSEDTFVCAFTHNEQDFFKLFDYIFILTIDDIELEQRLLNRPGHTIGKTHDEMMDILMLHTAFEKKLINAGAIPLNVQHGVHELVDSILQLARGTQL